MEKSHEEIADGARVDVDLTIAIPCFNEEANLVVFPDELFPFCKTLPLSYEVLLVNDGSTDNTQWEAERLRGEFPELRLISHTANTGLGTAMQTAICHARGKLLVFLDADLTYKPSDIARLLERYKNGNPACVNSSYLATRETRKDVTPFRLFLSWCANVLYWMALGVRLTCYTAIFRLYQTGILRSLPLRSTDFNVNAEILFHLVQNGYPVAEIPVHLGTRTRGVSKFSLVREIRNQLVLIGRIFSWRIKGFFARY